MENRLFYGVVEDRNDPLKIGRCRVRVAGFHTVDKITLPTADLPWAHVLSFNGNLTAVPREGSLVIVSFMDFPDCQQPIVIGAIQSVVQKDQVLIDDVDNKPFLADALTPQGRPIPTTETEATGGSAAGDIVTPTESEKTAPQPTTIRTEGQLSAKLATNTGTSLSALETLTQKGYSTTDASDMKSVFDAVTKQSAIQLGVTGPLAEVFQSIGGATPTVSDKYEQLRLKFGGNSQTAIDTIVKDLTKKSGSDVFNKLISGKTTILQTMQAMQGVLNEYNSILNLAENSVSSLTESAKNLVSEAKTSTEKVVSESLGTVKSQVTSDVSKFIKNSTKDIHSLSDARNVLNAASWGNISSFGYNLSSTALSAFKSSIADQFMIRTQTLKNLKSSALLDNFNRVIENNINALLSQTSDSRMKVVESINNIGKGYTATEVASENVGNIQAITAESKTVLTSETFKSVGEGNTPPVYGKYGGPNSAGSDATPTAPEPINAEKYPAGSKRPIVYELSSSVYGETKESIAQPNANSMTVAQVRKCAPQIPEASAQEFIRVATAMGYNAEHQAEFLSICAVESGNFTKFAEDTYYSSPDRIQAVFGGALQRTGYSAVQLVKNPELLANVVYSNRYGNGNVASADGWRFRGKGAIQVTFKANYIACANVLKKYGIIQSTAEVLTDTERFTRFPDCLTLSLAYGATRNFQKIPFDEQLRKTGNDVVLSNGKTNHGLKREKRTQFLQVLGMNLPEVKREIPEKYKQNAENLKKIGECLDRFGITTNEAKCAFLAVVGALSDYVPRVESCNYCDRRELKERFPQSFAKDDSNETLVKKYLNVPQDNASKFFNFVYDPATDGRAIGNTAPGDGWKYYGVGLLEIKGRSQYEKYASIVQDEYKSAVSSGAETLKDNLEACTNVAACIFLERMNGVVPTAHPQYINEAMNRFCTDQALRDKAEKIYNDLYGANTLGSYGVGDLGLQDGIGYYSSNPNFNPNLGFQDPYGRYPYAQRMRESSVGRSGRGDNREGITALRRANRRTGIPAGDGTFWSQPSNGYAAQYPYNHSQETEGGHAFELDDTPGAERTLIYHRKGTFTEVTANGTQTNRIVGDGYTIVDRNGFIYITGRANVTVGGNVNVYCQSNAHIKVEGSTELEFGGNLDVSVAKDLNVAVQGTASLWANGNLNLQTKQNAHLLTGEEMYLSSSRDMHLYTDNNFLGNIKGDYHKRVMGNATESYWGNVDVSIAGETFSNHGGSSHDNYGGDRNLRIEGNNNVGIGGNDSLTVSGKKDDSVSGRTAITSGGAMHVRSDSAMRLYAGGNMDVKSTGTTNVQASGDVNLDGTTVNFNGGNSAASASKGSPTAPSGSSNAVADEGLKAVINAMTPIAVGSPIYPSIPVDSVDDAVSTAMNMFESPAENGNNNTAIANAVQNMADQEHGAQPSEELDRAEPKNFTATGNGEIPSEILEAIKNASTFTADFRLSPHTVLGDYFDGGFNRRHKLVGQAGFSAKDIVLNLAYHANNVVEKVGEFFPNGWNGYRKVWHISSGFRNTSSPVNAKGSQHTKGQATDIQIYGNRTIKQHYDICKQIMDKVNFDQMILEYSQGNRGGAWVHISYDRTKQKQRHQVLTTFNLKNYNKGLILRG